MIAEYITAAGSFASFQVVSDMAALQSKHSSRVPNRRKDANEETLFRSGIKRNSAPLGRPGTTAIDVRVGGGAYRWFSARDFSNLRQSPLGFFRMLAISKTTGFKVITRFRMIGFKLFNPKLFSTIKQFLSFWLFKDRPNKYFKTVFLDCAVEKATSFINSMTGFSGGKSHCSLTYIDFSINRISGAVNDSVHRSPIEIAEPGRPAPMPAQGVFLGFVAEVPHEIDRPRQLIQFGAVGRILDSVAEGLYHEGIICITKRTLQPFRYRPSRIIDISAQCFENEEKCVARR